jgi:hypothetical protein
VLPEARDELLGASDDDVGHRLPVAVPVDAGAVEPGRALELDRVHVAWGQLRLVERGDLQVVGASSTLPSGTFAMASSTSRDGWTKSSRLRSDSGRERSRSAGSCSA